MKSWSKFIFSDEISFDEKAQKVFEYQFKYNSVYQRYCRALGVEEVSTVCDIPLLPIKAFKDTKVLSTEENSDLNTQDSLLFKSSGTSSMQRSVHQVANRSIYETALLEGFRGFYELDDAVIWGYTPGYDENPDSSLIYMIQKLIEQDESGLSRFLPLNEPLDEQVIKKVAEQGKQLILFGAAFGLLDLLEMHEATLSSNSIVIETGGMKTHRREISKKELHQKLATGFGIDSSRIHSEYGMCELLSQAYATGGQWFRTPSWMDVSIRNSYNSFKTQRPYQEGLIGIIDLANIHSCSFLLTGDRGIMDDRGRFQVLGRWNPKDLRGCNFLIEED